MQVNPGGGIEIVAQQSINLNLMSHLDPSGALDAAGVASALDALEDFALIARGFGVSAVHAVATAALRESGNGAALARAASERFGIPLRIIDGQDEAAYCFVGAIHGLPVSDGILVDIGGGSAEIVTFTDRRLQSVASLPLGSLRIANQFRLSDLPEADDVRAACDHVRATLTDAGVPTATGQRPPGGFRRFGAPPLPPGPGRPAVSHHQGSRLPDRRRCPGPSGRFPRGGLPGAAGRHPGG